MTVVLFQAGRGTPYRSQREATDDEQANSTILHLAQGAWPTAGVPDEAKTARCRIRALWRAQPLLLADKPLTSNLLTHR